MTLEEACRLIDPATDLDALAEIEYYNGFKGKDAAAKALHEASQMVVRVGSLSWLRLSWATLGENRILLTVWVCLCKATNSHLNMQPYAVRNTYAKFAKSCISVHSPVSVKE